MNCAKLLKSLKAKLSVLLKFKEHYLIQLFFKIKELQKHIFNQGWATLGKFSQISGQNLGEVISKTSPRYLGPWIPENQVMIDIWAEISQILGSGNQKTRGLGSWRENPRGSPHIGEVHLGVWDLGEVHPSVWDLGEVNLGSSARSIRESGTPWRDLGNLGEIWGASARSIWESGNLGEIWEISARSGEPQRDLGNMIFWG